MKIRFLGTSSGTPTKERNVSAITLNESKGRDWYLIDCGEGTQQQLLRCPLSLNHLRAICITHIHGDHCYGLPGLLASAGMNGRREPLVIIAPQGIKEWLDATLQHTQLFLPYTITYLAAESCENYAIGQFILNTITLSHRVPSFAYSFQDSRVEAKLDIAQLKARAIPQGALWGQLQAGQSVQHNGQTFHSEDFVQASDTPRKVIICGDNDTPAQLIEACAKCQLLIHESTFTADMAAKAGDVGHSYAQQVALFAEQYELPNLILTHFSPRYQSQTDASPSIHDIAQEARQAYTGNLHLAEDFQTYHLDKAGNLTLEAQ